MLKPLFTAFTLLAATLLAATVVHAQSVRWEPGSGTLAQNQLSDLSLVFDQCEPEGTVTLPVVTGLAFGSPNRSDNTAFTVVNFKASTVRTVTLTYRVRPTERRTLTVPSFVVATDKGRLTVPAATFEVGDATVGQTGLSLESIARSSFTVPARDVWVGEVFPLTYTLNASKRYLYNLNKDFDWAPSPLIPEPWSANPEQIEATLNNDPRVSVIYKTRALIKTPGTVAIPSATQLVNVSTGSSGFGPFSRANLDQFLITSAPAQITVRPLPAPAPAAFTGAIGTLTLDAKVVPAQASVGEPVTWTLTLAGTANWPEIAALPQRSVSKDFRIVQPQAKRTNKEGSLYDVTLSEDIVLIPTQPGPYTLPAVKLTYFNPATGTYETLATKPVTLQISPAPGTAPAATPAQNLTAVPASGPTPPPSSGAASTQTPPVPSALPRDPLPDSGTASTPLETRTVFFVALSSALAPLILWFVLACRRARQTDPVLPRRQARVRLLDTLRHIDSNPPAPNPQLLALLHSWRRDTALLLRVPHAAPRPSHFADDTWAHLWAEAERTCYGTARLPDDWTDRARRSLAAHRLPSFNPLQLFLPRNLLPLLLVLVSLLTHPAPAQAATASDTDARKAYASADFPSAEKTWRALAAATPTDWSARHNLSLTLSQQDRTGEAAGHALAAYVQHPQSPAVRAQLAYAWNAAGTTPVALKPFLSDAPLAALARLASPSRWQALLIASAWLLAASAALYLYIRYTRPGSKPLALASLIAALTALLGLASSATALHTYGDLADRRTVVVVTPGPLYSIPTEVEVPQKTTGIALGTLATADKTFLGWTRLRFPDGQTGWLRTETTVRLW